jgi:DNA-binding GntR family transcriptional regulator
MIPRGTPRVGRLLFAGRLTIYMSTKSKRKTATAAVTPLPRSGGASLGHSLYHALREEIIEGRLSAGDTLREIKIADRFRVSRTPVREALKKLQTEGLICDLPGQGITVTKPSLDEISDFYLIREVLEGLAARLAAERSHETEILTLQSVLRQAEDAHAADQTDRTIELTGRFDELLFKAARNPRLAQVIEALRASQGQSRRGNMRDKGRRAESLHERQVLIAAVEKRDGHGAEIAAQDHLRKARQYRISELVSEDSTN